MKSKQKLFLSLLTLSLLLISLGVCGKRVEGKEAGGKGERYYFNKDVLLKWRWVDKPFDVKERALKKHQSEAKPQYLYQNSTKKEKKDFDKEEVKMLNAAYNTLAAMKKKSEHGRLNGYVTDREGQPVKGAKVEVLENGKLVGELTTDEKGLYETGIMKNKDGYDLKISADGFGEVEVKGVKVAETDEVILVEVIILVKSADTESKVSLNLFDAEKTKEENKKYKKTPLKKAKVVVRKGMENRSGEIVLETEGNEKGEADFNLPNGIYTVEILVDGYVTAYRSLVVEGDVKESLPLVKKPKKKGMKIVVNWEGDADLDSTLFTPNEGVEGEIFYVGSGRKEEGKAKLLLDGKKDYTTEVISIEDASKGNFKYYVSDYTKARKKNYTSKDMKKLKLVVYVYDENGLVAVYTLPYEVNGIIWEVFEVKNGKVLPLQKTYSNVKGKSWWTKEKRARKKREIIKLEYDYVGHFSEGLVAVLTGNIYGKQNWGFVNKLGKEIIPQKYNLVRDFKEGLAYINVGFDLWGGKNGKSGYINKEGKEVVPPIYDSVGYVIEKMIAVEKENKWGFVNKEGKLVTSLKYEKANNFSEGLAAVKLKGKWGFINKSGKEVISPKYDKAFDFSEGLAAVKRGNKFGFINLSGEEVVFFEYDEVKDFKEGMAAVKKDDKWGFINKKGKFVVFPKYYSVGNFSEGLASVGVVSEIREQGSMDPLILQKYGFIDREGREVIPKKYDFVRDFKEGVAIVSTFKEGTGAIHPTGEEVIPLKYEWVNDFSEGLALVFAGDKYGFVDKKGKEVISLKYDKASDFSEGLAHIMVGEESEKGNNGFIDRKGRKVIPLRFDFRDPFSLGDYGKFSEGVAVVLKDGYWCFINKKGKYITR